MQSTSKIYIAGHRGLVGSALHRNLESKGYSNIITRTHKELDLTNQDAVEAFFKQEKPEFVFLAAAKVGGIMANNTYRADFLYENIAIQNNVIHQSYVHGVKKLMFLGSSCIYPKNCPQPMKEDALLTGVLEYTNEPYAIAKIAGLKMCESYNLQYGTNFISVMPTNLYGPNDNYDLDNSHVLPALIRKLHLAKLLAEKNMSAILKNLGVNDECDAYDILEKHKIDDKSLTLWGSGTPRREFLYSDDMADACVHLMETIDFQDLISLPVTHHPSPILSPVRNTHINIGTGSDTTIKDLAELIRDIVGYQGEITWDTGKPDGSLQKLLDVSRLTGLGWKAKTSLEAGIRRVYSQYIKGAHE